MGFAIKLGADELQLGLLGAMPFLFRPLQLLSAHLISRGARHRPIFVWTSAVHRGVWVVPAVLLFLPLDSDARLLLLLLTAAVSYAFMAPLENAWVSWSADYVPVAVRGRYFGTRNIFTGATGLAAGLTAAGLVDLLGEGSLALGHLCVFGAAVLVGAVSVYLLSNYPPSPRPNRTEFSIIQGLRDAFGNDNLRRFLVAGVCWSFALGVGGPFFLPHALNYVGFSYTTIQTYSVIATAALLATNRFWGRALDRFGARALLATCGVVLGFFPLVWSLTGPGLSWPLWPEAVLAGAFWSAMNLAVFAAPLSIATKNSRPYAIALVAVLSGLAYFGGSMAGGAVAKAVGGTVPLFGDWPTGYQLVFVISGVLRIASALFFLRLSKRTESYVRPLVAHLGETGFKRPAHWIRGLFLPALRDR
ncbi:MAG TPA: MFS transporter [Candidatus Coatesbacteria bacterium]|nr:MFS transporter [Candidatus Coatesbacteria bacterium]